MPSDKFREERKGGKKKVSLALSIQELQRGTFVFGSFPSHLKKNKKRKKCKENTSLQLKENIFLKSSIHVSRELDEMSVL